MEKTNIGLAEHCKMAYKQHWKYVLGTYGRLLTDTMLAQKVEQYPKKLLPILQYMFDNGFVGSRTADCSGLIKSYLWWNDEHPQPEYNPNTDKSADTMYSLAYKKGKIKTMPEVAGICVRKRGHVGVYICNNEVIESKGYKSGVVKTPLTGEGSTRWTHWYENPYIMYNEPSKIFSDIFESRWSASTLKAAKELRIVHGYPDGTFRPNQPLTRETGAVITMNMFYVLKHELVTLEKRIKELEEKTCRGGD